MRLFQKGKQGHIQKGYYQIFSNLREEVRSLEQRGIDSSVYSISDYKQIRGDDLPRQRGYYKEPIRIAKMVLSSTTGQSLESGDEELTMDYILDMENLFEEYSQIVLEDELNRLRSSPLYSGLSDVYVQDKKHLQLYQGNPEYHQPDHVIMAGDEPISVLDTKYYAEKNDPSTDRKTRMQIFTYAFLLDIAEMGFLTPTGQPLTRHLQNRDGQVALIRSEGSFSDEKYRTAVRNYLLEVLNDELDTSELIDSVRSRTICMEDAAASSISDVISSDALRIEDASKISRSIIGAAIERSVKVHAKRELFSDGTYFNLYNNLKDDISKHSEYDIIIPMFETLDSEVDLGTEEDETLWDGEIIRPHYIQVDNMNIEEVHTCDPFPLDWNGELSRL
jgi:hypothetical protein